MTNRMLPPDADRWTARSSAVMSRSDAWKPWRASGWSRRAVRATAYHSVSATLILSWMKVNMSDSLGMPSLAAWSSARRRTLRSSDQSTSLSWLAVGAVHGILQNEKHSRCHQMMIARHVVLPTPWPALTVTLAPEGAMAISICCCCLVGFTPIRSRA